MPILRPRFIKMDHPSLAKAIQDDFGLFVTDIEKIDRGYSSQVYQASLDGKTIFIRINDDPRVYPSEILGYKAFKDMSIPVPEIIAYKGDPKTIGFPTMIMAAAHGTELSKTDITTDQKDRVYESMGKMLKKIHEIRIEGYGPVKAEGQILKGIFQSWKDYWESKDESSRERIEYLRTERLLTDKELEKLTQVNKDIGFMSFGKASLLHTDITSAHVFVEKDQITGVIDLGRLQAGDPRYDIAMCLVFQDERKAEFFKKGYGELAHDPAILAYMLQIAGIKIALRSRRGSSEGAEKMKAVFRKILADRTII